MKETNSGIEPLLQFHVPEKTPLLPTNLILPVFRDDTGCNHTTTRNRDRAFTNITVLKGKTQAPL